MRTIEHLLTQDETCRKPISFVKFESESFQHHAAMPMSFGKHSIKGPNRSVTLNMNRKHTKKDQTTNTGDSSQMLQQVISNSLFFLNSTRFLLSISQTASPDLCVKQVDEILIKGVCVFKWGSLSSSPIDFLWHQTLQDGLLRSL